MQSGRRAALAEIVEEVHDVMKLSVGNLRAGEKALVTLEYVEALDISQNQYWRFAIGNTFSSRSTGSTPLSSNMQTVCDPPSVKRAYDYDLLLRVESATPLSYFKSPSHSHASVSHNK